MKEKKTVLEWLEELPDGYRERAIKNCDCLHGLASNLTDALIWAFSWPRSPEGEDFWMEVSHAARSGGTYPPLPEKEYHLMDGLSSNRHEYPLFNGLLDYFPDACAAVARHSYLSNEQHNPGEKMHWAPEKSIGTGDQIVRHLKDGMQAYKNEDYEAAETHLAALAWRGLELLQRFKQRMEPFNE